MSLQILWFEIIALLWTGYLVLEGFDFGVGMLTTILPSGDRYDRERERRLLINTIGPVWDGNEVWLLTAGGAMFAAFPEWYATLFSGFYLPLLLILVALIIRGVAFEYRGKINDPRWARIFDIALAVGSWIPAFLWGVAFANLVRGVLLDGNHQFIGGFWSLLSPFAILGGLATTLLFLLHGAVFVALKTQDPMRERANLLGRRLALASVVIAGGWAIWAQLAYSRLWTWLAVLLAAGALIGVYLMLSRRMEGKAFFLSALVMVAVVVLVFGSMYPDVMPGRAGGPSLSIADASSSPYTLRVMTWVALGLTPLVIAYQSWSYWVFKRRLSTRQIPPPAGLSWRELRKGAFGATHPFEPDGPFATTAVGYESTGGEFGGPEFGGSASGSYLP